MENDKGWVKLHRKICDGKLWFSEPFTKSQAWIDLFLNANHTEKTINIRGNVIAIKRGQLGWSELTMVKRWCWSKNRVRRFLKWLETEQQIEQQKDRFITTIITILHYEEYQQTEQQTIQQKDSRRYINKSDKNDKNDTATLRVAGKTRSEEKNTKYNPLGAEIIKEFVVLNPACGKYYNNTTQRAACDRLLEQRGLEQVKKVIALLAKTNRISYLPTITTPAQLEDKWASLEAGLIKEKGKQITSGRGIA